MSPEVHKQVVFQMSSSIQFRDGRRGVARDKAVPHIYIYMIVVIHVIILAMKCVKIQNSKLTTHQTSI